MVPKGKTRGTHHKLVELGQGDLAVAVVVETAPEGLELLGVVERLAELGLCRVNLRVIIYLNVLVSKA